MSEISAKLVQELRSQTGAGMMDCKTALRESNGSLEGALEYLRKKGMKDLGKRSGRVASEGTVGCYIHQGEQIVALVELNCETDFVARGDEFRKVARDLAMHVAAANPKYMSFEEVPSSIVEKEKEILLAQLTEAQKKNADKIIEGRLSKWREENCFLSQIFVKDENGKATIQSIVDELSVKTKEKVTLRRFTRFEVGEGIEKVESDFVSEVASMVGAK